MPPVLKQGQHPDPLDPSVPPPASDTWPPRRTDAYASREMQAYRAALASTPGGGVREGVLDDLSGYFGLDPDECVRRCIDWERWSVDEWQARHHATPDDIGDFYLTTKSWAFDLLWYAYLQAEGHAYPVSAAIALTLPRRSGRHLDFGSGVGVTSQLFAGLGYEVELADVSTSLLAFARYRLDRRGVSARYIDLNEEPLETGRYDVITAIDTLVHVPDVPQTAASLHRALRPGGLLFANFDVRPASVENAQFLYDDDLPLRYALQRAGFEPVEALDGMITRYLRVPSSGLAHAVRGARDAVLLRSPLRPMYRALRRAVAAAPGRASAGA